MVIIGHLWSSLVMIGHAWSCLVIHWAIIGHSLVMFAQCLLNDCPMIGHRRARRAVTGW
ncbi:MAG: hypothetical protein ACPGWR_31480 [Ardenticatenaceae bacterium]